MCFLNDHLYLIEGLVPPLFAYQSTSIPFTQQQKILQNQSLPRCPRSFNVVCRDAIVFSVVSCLQFCFGSDISSFTAAYFTSLSNCQRLNLHLLNQLYPVYPVSLPLKVLESFCRVEKKTEGKRLNLQLGTKRINHLRNKVIWECICFFKSMTISYV